MPHPTPADEHHRKIDALLAKHFEDDLRVQNCILKKLEGIEISQASMLGLLTMYNNAKGTVATIKAVAVLAAWLVLFTGSLSAIWYAIKELLKS